ncbi:MAG: PQQ-dependent sugar dehydrogenase [Deltaproteobacteria bacterium]|nr:PQQ-dependent sugar dehydrogenase [Deltaproteobacteria bacterium]
MTEANQSARCQFSMKSVSAAGVAALFAAAIIVASAAAQSLGTQRILTSAELDQPIFVGAPVGDDRLFVLERAGEILIYRNGALLATPFLSISGVDTSSEGGLLGLAFPADYATSGFFYVYYTSAGLTSRVSRFQVSADPDVADASSELNFFSLAQPFNNHNGGTLAIRGDYLYLGLGDGGGANDPGDRAQDNTNLFGQMVRWNISSGTPSSLEAYAYGLRNPFRFSFDRLNGDLYIGDVGQDAREEIDIQAGTDTSFRNYGWDVEEGTRCNDPDPSEPPCGSASFADPMWEYDHASSVFCSGSVTGGIVYRGGIAEIHGQYFFADYCFDTIWSFAWDGDAVLSEEVADRTSQLAPPEGTIDRIVAFGEDGFGEMYIVDLNGEVYKVVPEPSMGVLRAGIALLALLAERRRRLSR